MLLRFLQKRAGPEVGKQKTREKESKVAENIGPPWEGNY
jgi:hypothetical protein